MKKLKLSHRSTHACRAIVQDVPVPKWHTAPVHPVSMKMMNTVGSTCLSIATFLTLQIATRLQDARVLQIKLPGERIFSRAPLRFPLKSI